VFGVRVPTKNGYFVRDGGSDPPMEMATFRRDGVLELGNFRLSLYARQLMRSAGS